VHHANGSTGYAPGTRLVLRATPQTLQVQVGALLLPGRVSGYDELFDDGTRSSGRVETLVPQPTVRNLPMGTDQTLGFIVPDQPSVSIGARFNTTV
jgi:hypothetical protein